MFEQYLDYNLGKLEHKEFKTIKELEQAIAKVIGFEVEINKPFDFKSLNGRYEVKVELVGRYYPLINETHQYVKSLKFIKIGSLIR